jgi:hypothetical protein
MTCVSGPIVLGVIGPACRDWVKGRVFTATGIYRETWCGEVTSMN